MIVRIRFFHILNLLKMLPRFIYCVCLRTFTMPATEVKQFHCETFCYSDRIDRSVGQLRGMFLRKVFLDSVLSRNSRGKNAKES